MAKYDFSRTSVLDKTTSIDEANLQRVNDVSQMATEQLKRFDQNLSQTTSQAETYQKLREEMISSKEPEQKQTNGVYELEIVEPTLIPTISQKQEIEPTTAKLSLNLRGKLIVAVYASIILLLSILLIYNAVSIANYKRGISTTQQQIVVREAELSDLQQQLDGLLSDPTKTPEGMGMSQGSQNSIKNSYFEKDSAVKYSVDKNWFDSMCGFLSSIFGG